MPRFDNQPGFDCRPRVDNQPRRAWYRVSWILALVLAIVLAFPMAASAEPTLPSPSTWPLAGTPRVVGRFNPPDQRWEAGHRGVDLTANVGDQVLSAAAGMVTFAGRLAGRGVVVVDHGEVRTTYEPVAASVATGQQVSMGEVVGTLETGSHCMPESCLHWGLKQGDHYLDPTLLGGSTQVRLLPESAEDEAARRAAARALVAISASDISAADATGPGGEHGFLLPAAGPLTSPYGLRRHPVLGIVKLHDGTDIGAACGSEIKAPYHGRVSEAYFNAGYGNRLMIDHGTVDGRRVRTGSNHAQRYVVRVGQQVRQGQVIGYVGTTGYSTGCHLHVMVWLDGQQIDPMTWF